MGRNREKVSEVQPHNLSNFIMLLFGLLLFSGVSAQTQGCSGDKCVEACGEDWEKNGEHCYFFGTDNKNWTAAEDFCQRQGGHLASVTSNATNNFVLEGMNRTGLNHAWLGGNDIEEELTWKWTDCTPWGGITFWATPKTQPNKVENCMMTILKWTFDGREGWNRKWNDQPCGNTNVDGFVCSKKICSASANGTGVNWKLAPISLALATLLP